MDPGALRYWLEQLERQSPHLKVIVDAKYHSITIQIPNGECVKLLVTDSTVRGLENIAEATELVGRALQRFIDRTAAEELKRRGSDDAPTSFDNKKVVSIH